MQARRSSPNLTILLAIVVLVLIGCSRSPVPRFYALSATTDQFAFTRSSSGQDAVVGLGPVRLADYLDQSQIVTRTSENQLARSDSDRWGGPLRDNISNVLADNIGALLPTQQVHLFPWRQAVPIDYQVTVDVVRLDGRLGDGATLDSRWSLFQGPERKLVKTNRSTISEPVTGGAYADLVAAQSRALGRLSQEIVQAIRGSGTR